LEELIKWLSPIVRRYIRPGSFFKAIATGELLCMLVNIVGPEAIHISYTEGSKPRSYSTRNNVSNFLVACKQLGVTSSNLFKVEDLVERENDRRVVRTLIYLSLALVPYGIQPPPCVATFLKEHKIRLEDAPKLKQGVAGSGSVGLALDSNEGFGPRSPKSQPKDTVQDDMLMKRMKSYELKDTVATPRSANPDRPSSLSISTASVPRLDRASSASMWDLLGDQPASADGPLTPVRMNSGMTRTPRSVGRLKPLKSVSKKEKLFVDTDLPEETAEEAITREKSLSQLLTPSRQNKVERVEKKSVTTYSEAEWRSLTQSLDVSPLLLAQGDETLIDKVTIATILFPTFQAPLTYEGLDQEFTENRHANKYANMKEIWEHKLSRLSSTAVKRWNRRTANVRMNVKRNKVANFIAARPGQSMCIAIWTNILLLILIFFPVYHPIYFDVSVEQFRVEKDINTINYDFYAQALLESYLNYPPDLLFSTTSPKDAGPAADEPSPEWVGDWTDWAAYGLSFVPTPAKVFDSYHGQVTEHNSRVKSIKSHVKGPIADHVKTKHQKIDAFRPKGPIEDWADYLSDLGIFHSTGGEYWKRKFSSKSDLSDMTQTSPVFPSKEESDFEPEMIVVNGADIKLGHPDAKGGVYSEQLVGGRKLLVYTQAERTVYYTKFTLMMMNRNYSGQVLTPENLAIFHDLEGMVTGETEFTNICSMFTIDFHWGTNHPQPCRQQDSFLNYFYPSPVLDSDIVGPDVWLDGQGRDAANVSNVVNHLIDTGKYGHFTRTFMDTGEASHAVAFFLFSMPLAGYASVYDRSPEQTGRIIKYMSEVMVLKLHPLHKQYPDIFTVMDGTGVQEKIFSLTITNHDIPLLICAIFFVFLFVWFHTASSLMAFLGIFGIFMCFLPWLFVYRVICGIETFSVLSLLSFFLIFAIGTDDCFVVWDTWKYSVMLDLRPEDEPNALNAMKQNFTLGEESDELRDILFSLRLAWTLREAGSALIITTTTSIVSFFSICFTAITPVFNFGVFMGGLCITNFILVMTWYPACCVYYETHYKNHCRSDGAEKAKQENLEAIMMEKQLRAQKEKELPQGEEVDQKREKRGVELVGSVAGELSPVQTARILRETNKKNTKCRECLLATHLILYRFRVFFVTFFLFMAFGCAFTIRQLEQADQVITLLPPDSNFELMNNASKSFLAICDGCTYAVNAPTRERSPYPTPVVQLADFSRTNDTTGWTAAASTLPLYPYNFGDRYDVATRAVGCPSTPFVLSVTATAQSIRIVFRPPEYPGSSAVAKYVVEIVPYPIPARYLETPEAFVMAQVGDLRISGNSVTYTLTMNSRSCEFTDPAYASIPSEVIAQMVEDGEIEGNITRCLRVDHDTAYMVRVAALNLEEFPSVFSPVFPVWTENGTPILPQISLITFHPSYFTVVLPEPPVVNDFAVTTYELIWWFDVQIGSATYQISNSSLVDAGDSAVSGTGTSTLSIRFDHDICAVRPITVALRVANELAWSGLQYYSTTVMSSLGTPAAPEPDTVAFTYVWDDLCPLCIQISFWTRCQDFEEAQVEALGFSISDLFVDWNSALVQQYPRSSMTVEDVFDNETRVFTKYVISVDNLTPNRNYTMGVEICSISDCSAREITNGSYPSIALDSPPPDTFTLDNNDSWAELRWTAPVFDFQYDHLTVNPTYRLSHYADESSNSWNWQVVYSGPGLSFAMGGLTPGIRHHWKISAFNGWDWSAPRTACGIANTNSQSCAHYTFPNICIGTWCMYPNQCVDYQADEGPVSMAPASPVSITFSEVESLHSDKGLNGVGSTLAVPYGAMRAETRHMIITNKGLEDLVITGLVIDESESTGCLAAGFTINDATFYFKGGSSSSSFSGFTLSPCTSAQITYIGKPDLTFKVGVDKVCSFRVLYRSTTPDGVVLNTDQQTAIDYGVHARIDITMLSFNPPEPITALSLTYLGGSPYFVISLPASTFPIQNILYRERDGTDIRNPWVLKHKSPRGSTAGDEIYMSSTLGVQGIGQRQVMVTASSAHGVGATTHFFDLLDCAGKVVDNDHGYLPCHGAGMCANILPRTNPGSPFSGTICECFSGYNGAYCQSRCPLPADNQYAPQCSDHGVCAGSTCFCSDGYAGPACERQCPSLCNGNGVCSIDGRGQPVCQCFSGYTGTTCAYEASNSPSNGPTPSPTAAPTREPYSGETQESAIPGLPYTSFDFGGEIGYSGPTIPNWALGQVYMVWGVTGIEYDENRFDGTYGTLVYDPSFDLTSVEAQDFMLKLCDWIAYNPMMVFSYNYARCFFRDFYGYLQSLDPPVAFPVPDPVVFTDLVIEYLGTGLTRPFLAPYDEWIGFTVSENGDTKIDFIIVTCYVNFDGDGSSVITTPILAYWDKKMPEINAVAPASLKHGVHASAAWVRNVVEERFITGLVSSYAMSMGCEFLALCFLTRNANIAAISTLTVIVVIILMMALLIANGLKLGAMEAISLQIIVGLAVDYLFHLAHAYSHSTFYSPFARARYAFLSIGGSVLSGATASLIVSFCCIFAATEVLVTVGKIIFFMTLVAFIMGSWFLLPMLMIFGTKGPKVLTQYGFETPSLNPDAQLSAAEIALPGSNSKGIYATGSTPKTGERAARRNSDVGEMPEAIAEANEEGGVEPEPAPLSVVRRLSLDNSTGVVRRLSLDNSTAYTATATEPSASDAVTSVTGADDSVTPMGSSAD
jgi:hypothetical protein